VFLYDLDSLNIMVSENITRRRAEVPKIQTIIAEEMAEFSRWHTSLETNPTIAALTDLIERIRSEEVADTASGFEEKDRERLEMVTKRIVKRILHAPIADLRDGHNSSLSDRLEKISVVRKIFGIDAEHKKRSSDR